MLSLIFVAVVQAAQSPGSASKAPAVAKDVAQAGPRASLFQWFDSLGYTDLYRRRFVKITRWNENFGKPSDKLSEYGFEASSDTPMVAFGLPFIKFADPNDTYWKYQIEKADFASWAKSQLDIYRGKKRGNDPWVEGLQVRRQFDILAAARAAEELGYPSISKSWIAELLETQEEPNQWNKRPPTLLESIRQEAASDTISYIIFELGDQTTSRSLTLNALDYYLFHFPKEEDAPFAREASETLRRMIAKTSRHEPPAEPMSVEQRIDELIFQLQDQGGKQIINPGECDVFYDPPNFTSKTPAHMLVHIGYPAVLKLIASLSDRRFSRASRNWKYPNSNRVLRVGEVCNQILERIANRSFTSFSGDFEPATVKAKAEAWWQEFQKKGERQFLLNAVVKGDQDSPSQAARLIARYPADAMAAIAQGLTHSKDAGVRVEFLRVLLGRKDPPARQIARQFLCEGRTFSERFMAANLVSNFDKNLAVDRMMGEWRVRGTLDSNDRGDLGAWLIQAGNVKAIQTVRMDMPKLLRPERLRIVTGFIFGVGDHGQWFGYKIGEPRSLEMKRYSAELEAMLASLLTDHSTEYGSLISASKSATFVNPRICDIAGYALSSLWPKRYEFQLHPSLQKRERYLIREGNVWRKAHGQRLLKTPKPFAKASSPNVIVTMEMKGPWNRWPSLATALSSLKGNKFTKENIREVLKPIFAAWPDGLDQVHIFAEQEADGSGFHGVATLTKGKPADKELFVISENVLADGEGLLTSTMTTSMSERQVDDCKDLFVALQKALTGPLKQVTTVELIFFRRQEL